MTKKTKAVVTVISGLALYESGKVIADVYGTYDIWGAVGNFMVIASVFVVLIGIVNYFRA